MYKVNLLNLHNAKITHTYTYTIHLNYLEDMNNTYRGNFLTCSLNEISKSYTKYNLILIKTECNAKVFESVNGKYNIETNISKFNSFKLIIK